MKIKAGKTYRTLFFSDIHYLLDYKIKKHSHRDLFWLLDHFKKKGIRFQRIILVGDILENWYFSASRRLRHKKGKKRFNKLFDRLDALCVRRGEKIFIIGNHDSVNYNLTLPSRIENYLESSGWEIREIYEDQDIVVAHGHQGQYGKIFWFVNISFVKIVYFFARFFPHFFQLAESFYRRHFNFDRNETPQQVLKYYSLLSKRLKQGNRLLISGHTHQFMASEELYVINTGDWIDSRTLVIQDGRTFGGFSLQHGKNLRNEFCLTLRNETYPKTK